MYYAPFLIVIANRVGYICFFLTLTNFGLTAFELKFPFYTAGRNIPSNVNASCDGFSLISFIVLFYMFFHSCANWCKIGTYIFVKTRAIQVEQTPHTLQNLYHSDETRLEMERVGKTVFVI